MRQNMTKGTKIVLLLLGLGLFLASCIVVKNDSVMIIMAIIGIILMIVGGITLGNPSYKELASVLCDPGFQIEDLYKSENYFISMYLGVTHAFAGPIEFKYYKEFLQKKINHQTNLKAAEYTAMAAQRDGVYEEFMDEFIYSMENRYKYK